MKFSSPCGNVTPGLERNRDGENSSLVTHGTFPIPHSWLSSCGKIKIPHLRLRRSWGIFISSRLLSHSWGIGKYLLWLVGKDPLTLLWDPPQGFSKHHLIKREEPFSYGKIYFVHFGEVSTP